LCLQESDWEIFFSIDFLLICENGKDPLRPQVLTQTSSNSYSLLRLDGWCRFGAVLVFMV
jgi:hypothetical protein